MGGKHKQAQRVKNNARPSSSGRSAELLGTSLNQFVGFSAVKNSNYVSGVPGLTFNATAYDDVDSNLDVNFQLVFKKMNKKDGTTKLKALQEFTELVKASEPQTVKTVLSIWPRIYTCLVVDVEHRVREAVHFAHQAVVVKVKRNLAPYLKQLVGPWFTSQYDTYPPAASAAKMSFEITFPPNKIPEAIAFCQDEILQYICDNICSTTPETIRQTRKLTPEEAEAKYERIMISSLQGYTLYLNKLTTEQLEAAKDINYRIVSNSQFWKLVKVKVPLIRAAWFGCITALCQNAPFLLEYEAENAIGAVFSNLDESEPTVLPAAWEAALLIVTNIKDWWKYVNIEKLVLPKLWKILREGGQGSATVIYPNLLPLVSQFPLNISSTNFYSNFFSSLLQGLKKHVLLHPSRSEFSAIITAFTECLRYIIMKNIVNVEECESLILSQLLPTIEWSLTDKNIFCKVLFNEVSMLLQYWSKNSTTEEYKNYQMYLKCFWESLESIFHKSLNLNRPGTDKTELLNIASKQVELLLCLKRQNISRKKDVKVKFDSHSKVEKRSSTPASSESISYNLYLKDLNEIAYKTCYLYLGLIKNENFSLLIPSVLSLIQEFDNYDLFKYLNQQFSASNSVEKLINLYDNILLEILTKECSELIVDIIFILFKHLSTKDKEEILNSLTDISVNDCLFWSARRAIHHPYCNDEVVQKWLSNKKVTDLLVKIASSILTNDITSDQMLFLKQALSQNGCEGILISQESYTNIITILCDALLSPSEYLATIDRCASFAAYLSSIIYTEKTLLSHGDQLVLALFSFSCNNNYDKETVGKDTLWEVNTAWQDIISLFHDEELLKPELQNLIWKFTKIIQNNFLNQNTFSDMDYLKDAIVDLIKAVISRNNRVEDLTFMINSVLILPEQIRSSISPINDLCMCAELIQGDISWFKNCPVSSDILEFPTKDVEILRYLMWYQLVIQVINEFFTNTEEQEDNSENVHNLKDVEDIHNIIISAFFCYASVKCFSENYKNTKLYSEICPHLEDMDNTYCQFIKNVLVSKQMYPAILKKIKTRTNDLNWAKYFTVLISTLSTFESSLSKSVVYTNMIKNREEFSDVHCIQLTQLFADSLPYENVIEAANKLQKFIITRAMINSSDNEVQIAEALSILMIKENQQKELLYNSNVSSMTWEETQLAVEAMRLLTAIIKHRSLNLTASHWDFVIISLAAWANSIQMSKNNYSKINVSLFITAFCDLYSVFQEFITNEESMKTIPHSCSEFVDEYIKLFAQDVHIAVLNIWLHIAETELSAQEHFCLKKLQLFNKVGKVIFHWDCKILIKPYTPVLQYWQQLLNLSGELLKSSEKVLQLWGYHSLQHVIRKLIAIDTEFVQLKPHGTVFPTLEPVLASIQEVVHVMLMEFKLGEDTCRVEPFTDSYRFTFGYLLLWDLLLNLCKNATTDLRFQYLDWLRSGVYVKELLNNLFRLMPTEALHCIETKKKTLIELFSVKPSLSMSDESTSENLEHLVCWVYAQSLAHLSALVRQWWTDSDPRVGHTVEQVTMAYVSPHLCSNELQDVIEKEKLSKHNMKIKVHLTSREVIAVYVVDEARMELIVTLPTNYPLGSVQVDCSKQIGGPSQWRNWVMQLTMFLTHQNGSIWDGLSLWKNNLDKKFDGVEECYICFSVLHSITYQLPKLICQTCRKKFHSTCLYRWFSTSNKSTCPICRNLF